MNRAALLLASLLALSGCGISSEEHTTAMEVAKACTPGEACVPAGGGQCTCSQYVAESQRQAMDDSGDAVRCWGAQVECATPVPATCREGRCQ